MSDTTKPKVEYVKDSFPIYLAKKDHISASGLKTFMISPRMYYYEAFEKVRTEDERHFSVGSALHELVLEPHQFNENYVVCPKVDKRTTAGKQQYANFLVFANGKTVLMEDEMEMIRKMAEVALKNKTLTELMQDSYREISCYTTDSVTGLKLKMRPDSMCKTKSTIVDIKSCLDSSPKKFTKDVYNYGYSISAAYYSDFLQRENYLFAALEKQQPYQCTLFGLSDEMLEYGRNQYRLGLDLMAWCRKNNYWPDYAEFEILKECAALDNLDDFFDILEKSELITILK